MAAAVRAVTSQRGHDPRRFALVSFGGAGGLHACAVAAALDVPRVVVPPYCGVLSAFGMVVAPPVADVSRTVVHLAAPAWTTPAWRRSSRPWTPWRRRNCPTPHGPTDRFADVRFRGQSYELKVPVPAVSLASRGRRVQGGVRRAVRPAAAGPAGGGGDAAGPAGRPGGGRAAAAGPAGPGRAAAGAGWSTRPGPRWPRPRSPAAACGRPARRRARSCWSTRRPRPTSRPGGRRRRPRTGPWSPNGSGDRPPTPAGRRWPRRPAGRSRGRTKRA